MTHEDEPHYKAKPGIGGLDVDLRCEGKSLVCMQIPDEDLVLVIERGLERLSGQGKVTEHLKQVCRMVGDL